MRLLVCGGRTWGRVQYPADEEAVRRARLEQCQLFEALGELVQARGEPSVVIHGGARGADYMAGRWAREHHYPELVFKADWDQYEGMAGPIRNVLMLEDGKPDLVMAFPGGRGTANMVKLARYAGVEVQEFKP